MSSYLRTFAQIPSRIRYFVVLTEFPENVGLGGPGFDYDPTIALPSYPGPILSNTEFAIMFPDTYTYPSLTPGELLKDLGQQFIITINNKHYAIYRRVQRVNGANSEGVGGSPATNWNTFYIKVWDAAGGKIYVARTG